MEVEAADFGAAAPEAPREAGVDDVLRFSFIEIKLFGVFFLYPDSALLRDGHVVLSFGFLAAFAVMSLLTTLEACITTFACCLFMAAVTWLKYDDTA